MLTEKAEIKYISTPDADSFKISNSPKLLVFF